MLKKWMEEWKERRRARRIEAATKAAAEAIAAKIRHQERIRQKEQLEHELNTTGFTYNFGENGTDCRINIQTQRVYLKKHILASLYIEKIYPISDLRDVEWRWVSPDRYEQSPTRVGREGHMHAIGANIGGAISTAMKNSAAKKEAAAASGLFISVADIENPQYQIFFNDKNSLLIGFEIMQQAIEGRLK